MTVSFTPDGGGAISLAGAEADISDGPLGLRGSSQIMVQEDPLVDADFPSRLGRGNQVVEVSFSVKKKHASYEAAVAYWMTHIAACNDIGTCTFVQGSASLSLGSADVVAEGFPNGATSEWTYRVRGIHND